MARAHGVTDIGVWGFRACEATSSIAPADPAEVWRRVGVAMRGWLTEGTTGSSAGEAR